MTDQLQAWPRALISALTRRLAGSPQTKHLQARVKHDKVVIDGPGPTPSGFTFDLFPDGQPLLADTDDTGVDVLAFSPESWATVIQTNLEEWLARTNSGGKRASGTDEVAST